uniref:Profilin n=1 Tax=Gasterosteus aculeatus aculeatus TaxID=481459 RepID=A0AAQ4Q6M3_GASAC
MVDDMMLMHLGSSNLEKACLLNVFNGHAWTHRGHLLRQSLSVQPEEIDVLTGKDRMGFFTTGITLGNKKCSVIRDSISIENDWTMDIRTKSQGGEPTYNISLGKATKALVVVMGKEGIHGGQLNKKAFSMAEYLRKSGY